MVVPSRSNNTCHFETLFVKQKVLNIIHHKRSYLDDIEIIPYTTTQIALETIAFGE